MLPIRKTGDAIVFEHSLSQLFDLLDEGGYIPARSMPTPAPTRRHAAFLRSLLRQPSSRMIGVRLLILGRLLPLMPPRLAALFVTVQSWGAGSGESPARGVQKLKTEMFLKCRNPARCAPRDTFLFPRWPPHGVLEQDRDSAVKRGALSPAREAKGESAGGGRNSFLNRQARLRTQKLFRC